jgi:hypothetical protein
MTPKQVERLEKTLGRVAREQGLDQERLRRWVSFLALCGVLESGVEKGVIDIFYCSLSGLANGQQIRVVRARRRLSR